MHGGAAGDSGGRTTGRPVLECKGLDVGYGKLTVARDITFALQPRKVLTVLGPQRGRQDHAADDAGRIPAAARPAPSR